MSDWHVTYLLFNVVKFGIGVAVYLVVQRYRISHPRTSRLLSRAVVLWMAGVVTGLVPPLMSFRFSFSHPFEWTEFLVHPGVWLYFSLHFATSLIYAIALWHIAYAALARPDAQHSSS
jgi:hypothetical protein